MRDFAEARARMVERQLARRGIRDSRVLDAAGRVPRECFLAENLAEFAYDDAPLPIAAGQTISQPYVVALMVQEGGLKRTDRVLEVGSGSGYAAALMSLIAGKVFTIERHPELAEEARGRLAALGYSNVELRIGDGTLGWPEAAPYDAILVAADGPEVPETLRRQLKPAGRLIMPVGPQTSDQRLLRVTRTGENSFSEEDLGGVMFVPLIGQQGWTEDGLPPGLPSRRASQRTAPCW